MLSLMFMDTIKTFIKQDLFVITSLVSRDFKLKYRRSILGVLWSVLNPLLMMLVLTVVFSYMFRFDIENFPLYLILGNILFTFMNSSTASGLRSIIDSAALIKKVRINKAIFPIEKVVFELVNFSISLIAVAAVFIYFCVVHDLVPTLNILFLPFLVFYVLLFCTGLSLILSALTVFFRDIIHLWGVVTMAWMYLSAIFYPIDKVPAWLQQALLFNPMYRFITYFREIIMWGTTPSLVSNIICFVMGAATLAVGIFVFCKLQYRFILYV